MRVSVSVVMFLVIGVILAQPLVAAAQDGASTPSAGVSAATPPMENPSLVEFVAEIRLGADPMSAPMGMAVGADGTLYVIDALKNEIHVLDPAGVPIATWGTAGDGPGQFAFSGENGAWGDLAFGPDGNLYVLDPFNGRVQVLDPKGEYLREWGGNGSGPGELSEPGGIAVDGAGRVYVVDTDNGRVQIFDDVGTVIQEIIVSTEDGGPMREPGDVAVGASGLFVSDLAANRIYHFDANGELIGVIGEKGDAPGQVLGPWGVVVDGTGRLFVVENIGNRIQVFHPDGTVAGIVGTTGVLPGQFIGLHYAAIGPDNRLYVSDVGNRRIQVFDLLPSEGGSS